MIRLSVWLRLPDGEILQAGELAATDPDPARGGMRGEFRYLSAYLDDPRAFALDPVHLPLSAGIFSADRPRAGVHAVFEDALPDDWGRGLLVRKHKTPPGQQRVPVLLGLLGMGGLGALGYPSLEGGAPREAPRPVEASLADLPALVRAAELHARGAPVQGSDLADLGLLFRAGSSPGGARPKAVIQHAGMHWIAKFPSAKDEVDVVRIEAATLSLARSSGLDVPEFQVVEPGRTPVYPDFDALLDLAGHVGISTTVARKTVNEVCHAISGWADEFLSHGAPPADIDRLAASINTRLQRCRPGPTPAQDARPGM